MLLRYLWFFLVICGVIGSIYLLARLVEVFKPLILFRFNKNQQKITKSGKENGNDKEIRNH